MIPRTAPDESNGKETNEVAALPSSPAAAVRDAGELHRLLVDSIQDFAIVALDRTGYILSWNAGAATLGGYSAAEAIGQPASIFYPPELGAEGFPEFELRTASNTGRFATEGWRVRKDGTRFWASVVLTALRDEAGALIGFANVIRDLTERPHAEDALGVSEESFRLLVDGVKDYAIFMLDPTGRVITWNAGAERIKGYSRQEIIGQSFSRFYQPVDIASSKPQRALEQAVRTGKYEDEGWRVCKDGSVFWANVLITALRNQAGELIGFAKVTRDLTERRAAELRALEHAQEIAAEEAARQAAEDREQELRMLTDKLRAQAVELETRTYEANNAQRRADEANRVKMQFLAAMSHELRTPLNAIGGYADLLTMGLSGGVTALQIEQLGRIKRSQEHLLGIINDILNFSRIEAGQLSYEFGPVPLHEVTDSVMQMVSPQLHAKGLHFEVVDCPPDIIAWADRTKVGQILLNLVSNAMKFTDRGGSIICSCERLESGQFAVHVRDTGCGVAPEHTRAIFEPFVQVGRTLTAARQGTGLGLAISRDLARAMYGDLVVESAVDVGSTFSLTLPAPDSTSPLPSDSLPR